MKTNPPPVSPQNVPTGLGWTEIPPRAREALEGAMSRFVGGATPTSVVASAVGRRQIIVVDTETGWRIFAIRGKMYAVLCDVDATSTTWYVGAPLWRPLQSPEHVRALRSRCILPASRPGPGGTSLHQQCQGRPCQRPHHGVGVLYGTGVDMQLPCAEDDVGMKGGRLLLSGSRHWSDIRTVRLILQELRPDFLILGCARGLDRIGYQMAILLAIPHQVCYADWLHLGTYAGHKRNADMLACGPDRALLFHTNLAASTGTANMRDQLEGRGIPYAVVAEPFSVRTLPAMAVGLRSRTESGFQLLRSSR